MSEIPDWWLKGDWFDVCSCNIACPCEFAQPPTGDHCEGVLAWNVREGLFGEVDLAGLSVVAVSSFDGNVWDKPENFEMGLLIDERADADQRDALTKIMTGQAGGFMAGLAKLVSRSRGVEFAPISFEIADDLAYWRATIPGRVDAAADALGGPTTPKGKRVQLLNPPGSEVGPGGPATWATATRNQVDAFDHNWDWSGKSSKHIPFDWVGP